MLQSSCAIKTTQCKNRSAIKTTSLKTDLQLRTFMTIRGWSYQYWKYFIVPLERMLNEDEHFF